MPDKFVRYDSWLKPHEAMIDDLISRFDRVFASCGNVERLRTERKKGK